MTSEPAPQHYYGPPPVGPPPPAVPEGLALAVLLLGGLYTVVEVLLFATSFGAADAYGEAARTGTRAVDVWTTYDLVGLGYLLLLPLWIVTSVFLRRARRRAIALAPGFTHERGPVWTWLGWVVPIVSLWFPFQVVRDIARNAWRDPWGDQRQHLNLGFWWAAWLVTLALGQVAERAIPWSGVPDADAVARLPMLHGALAAATVIGFLLWVRIVNSIVRALEMPPSPPVTDVTHQPM